MLVNLTSPIFVFISGLTPEAVPCNEMITIVVPGLTIGSDRDILLNSKMDM